MLGWSVLWGVMEQRFPRTSGSNAICIVKMVHNLHVTSQDDFDVKLCVIEIQLVKLSAAS